MALSDADVQKQVKKRRETVKINGQEDWKILIKI